VVVLTESGKILNHEVTSFLKRREFVGTDNYVAARFAEILEGDDSDEDEDDGDEISIDNTEVGVDPAFAALLGNAAGSAEGSEDNMDSDDSEVALGDQGIPAEDGIPVFLPAEHDGLALNEHFLGYSSAPLIASGDTLHTLRFMLDSTLNIEQVEAVFDNKIISAPTLMDCIIDSHAERLELIQYLYVGTFLEVDSMGNGVAAVYLRTNKEIPGQVEVPTKAAAAAPAVEKAPTHVIPQLSTSSAPNVVVNAGNAPSAQPAAVTVTA
jgi:hypothetical protein